MGQALGTQLYTFYKSSFSVIHQVGKIGSFALFNIENKLYRGINHFNFNLKQHDKCQFVLKLIWLLIVCNLFPLEVVQKLQCCQLLCILGKLDCNLLISLQLIYTWLLRILCHAMLLLFFFFCAMFVYRKCKYVYFFNFVFRRNFYSRLESDQGKYQVYVHVFMIPFKFLKHSDWLALKPGITFSLAKYSPTPHEQL